MLVLQKPTFCGVCCRGGYRIIGQSIKNLHPFDHLLKIFYSCVSCCCSVAKCYSLQSHEMQHTRLPCPSLPSGVCSNSCPLNWWCHPTISSSVAPFSCPQSFPASGSFPMSQFFALRGQSIRASALASVIPINIQGWFPLGLTGLIFLQSRGFSRVFSNTTIRKHQFFGAQPSLWPNSHPYTTTGKHIALTIWTFVGKVVSLPRSMSFYFVAAVIVCSDLGAQESKICHCFHFPPFYLPWSDGIRCHNLSFWMFSFK